MAYTVGPRVSEKNRRVKGESLDTKLDKIND
ncbi:uncharacterized protein G2W53_034155 [Senna tora]|uniref:Uncharacterized protein n=1 Tax=Senna tora TaxID=362788 RepID=A0A834TAJ5_9FABA|nr:uncharacterized protein G2W53_034155 [Senna tora]